MAEPRTLNPAFIDKALLVLRLFYLGNIYPAEVSTTNFNIPVGKLLLDPGLAKDLSDQIGEFDLKRLQQAIEQASLVNNTARDVANKIIGIQNLTTQTIIDTLRAAETLNFGVPGVGEMVVKPSLRLAQASLSLSKLPKIPGPFTGKYLDKASQLFFLKANQVGQEAESKRAIDEQKGYALPEGASALDTAIILAKLIGQSLVITKLMRGKALPLDLIIRTEEYKTGIKALDDSIRADVKFLMNDPVFKNYVETFPVGFDTIENFMTGGLTSFRIPVRELMTAINVASDSERVRMAAYRAVTFQENPKKVLQDIVQGADEELTRSIITKDFAKKRIGPDLMTAMVITSPMFWEKLGLSIPTPNLAWESLRGIASEARSVGQRMHDTSLGKFVNFFRDKKSIRLEQFEREIGSWIDNVVGTKEAPEIAKSIKGSVNLQLKELSFNWPERVKAARAFHAEVQDAVRARVIGMTPAQKTATVYREQMIEQPSVINLIKDQRVLKVINDPEVKEAAEWVHTVQRTAHFEDPGRLRSAYFANWRAKFTNDEEFVAAFQTRPWKLQRKAFTKKNPKTGKLETVAEPIVLPRIETIDENFVNLADRIAGPRINTIMEADAKDASTLAAIIISKTKEHLDLPERITAVESRLARLPVEKRSDVSREISELLNFMFLTKRAGAWMAIEHVDDSIRTAINVYDNFKAGKFATFDDIRFASRVKPPSELYSDNFASHFLYEQDPQGWRILSSHKAMNQKVFGVSADLAKYRLNNSFAINLAQEINLVRRLNGLGPLKPFKIPEETLQAAMGPLHRSVDKKTGAYRAVASEEGIARVTTLYKKVTLAEEAGLTDAQLLNAVKTAANRAKDYQLARYHNSAFTTHAATTLLATYVGFFQRLSAWSIQELGRSPEIFRALGATMNLLREVNNDASDFNKESMEVLGRQTAPFRKVSMYGLIKLAADSLQGEANTNEQKLKGDMDNLRKLAFSNPSLALQILEKRPDLENLQLQSNFRAATSFLDKGSEYQLVPRSIAGSVAARLWSDVRSRTPHWTPWGKEMDEFMVGLGLPLPFARFNSAAATWTAATFEKDAAQDFNKMWYDGRGEKFGYDMDKMQDEAKHVTEIKWLKNVLVRNATGLGPETDKIKTDLYNNLQTLFDVKRLLVMPEEDRAEISKRTGIVDDEIIDFVWRNGYESANEFKQKATDAVIDLYKTYPRFQDFTNTLDWARQNKKSGIVGKEIMDTLRVLNLAPIDVHKDLTDTDRTTKAFLGFYKMETFIDENGDKFRVEIAGGDGETIFDFAKMTAKEKEAFVFSDDDRVSIIRSAFPDEYHRLRQARPNGFYITPPETAEQTDATNILRPVFDVLKEINPLNPFGYPEKLSEILLKGQQERLEPLIKKMGEVKEKVKQKWKDIIFDLKLDLSKPGLIANSEAAPIAPELRAFNEIWEKQETPHIRAAKKESDALHDRVQKGLLSAIARGAPVLEAKSIAAKILNAEYEDLSPPAQKGYILDHGTSFAAWHSPSINPNNRSIKDMANVITGITNYQDINKWMDRGRRLFFNETSTPEAFQEYLKDGEDLSIRDTSAIEVMNKTAPATLKMFELKGEGRRHMFGFERYPEFDFKDIGQQKLFNKYISIHYAEPDETRTAYEVRARDEIRKLSAPERQDMESYLQKTQQTEILEVYQKVAIGQETPIPLDRVTQLRIKGLKDRLPFIENDPVKLREEMAKQPDLIEAINGHDPRLARSLNNRLFGAIDQSGLAYVQGSDYAPGDMQYYRNTSPSSWARMYYENSTFRSRADQLGMTPPAPGAESSVEILAQDESGKTITTRVPSVLAPPEPLLPPPIAPGTFNSVPNMLNFAANAAKREANLLSYKKSQGFKLTKDQQSFLDLKDSSKTFQMIPSSIGRAFRSGQVTPTGVVKLLSDVNAFGTNTGLISPDQSNSFGQFLNNSTSVLGAANFGARIGQFLDNAFNLPRIPIESKAIDFFLFGGQPTSTKVTTEPGYIYRSTSAPTMNQGSPAFSAPVEVQPGDAGLPQGVVGPRNAAIPKGPDQVQTAGTVAGAGAQATAGIPGLGTALGIISAGFTIANIVRSRRRRRAAQAEARRRQDEQNLAIARAQAKASATQLTAAARRINVERFRGLQRQQQATEQDFNRRLSTFVREGATFATLAQQPRAFINRFVDRFEPQVIEFERRPTFASRVGLISQIESSLPRVRF